MGARPRLSDWLGRRCVLSTRQPRAAISFAAPSGSTECRRANSTGWVKSGLQLELGSQQSRKHQPIARWRLSQRPSLWNQLPSFFLSQIFQRWTRDCPKLSSRYRCYRAPPWQGLTICPIFRISTILKSILPRLWPFRKSHTDRSQN